jgi:hypothetical protein
MQREILAPMGEGRGRLLTCRQPSGANIMNRLAVPPDQVRGGLLRWYS